MTDKKQHTIEKERRAKSLRNLKRFEVISIIVLTAVLVFLSYHILQSYRFEDVYKEVWGREATFTLSLLFWGAITLQGALMLRAGFVRNAADNRITKDPTDHPFKGWRFTVFIPVLATLILLPAILEGVFNDEDVNSIGSFFLILTLSYMALLLSALVAAFIITPLELLFRGIVGLLKGDTSKVDYVIFGLFIAGLTLFIILGSMAVSADLPYPVGSFQVLLALLGIPGGYTVNDETLLWVTRGVLAIIIGFCVYAYLTGKKSKAHIVPKAR